MLHDWEAPYLQSLIRLIETQSKETILHWVITYCEEEILKIWILNKPDDFRPQSAIQAAHDWMEGRAKFPFVKKAILACHEAAREASDNPIAQAAARAIGQSVSTIHSVRHCIGLALYGAIAVSYHELGVDASWSLIESRASEECLRMENVLQKIAISNEPHPVSINWKCQSTTQPSKR